MKHLQQLQAVYPAGEARALYRLVMEVRFGLTQTDLLLGKDNELSSPEQAELRNIIQRLLKKEPVQYILGQEEFCGHTFHVRPGVLIPRPETQQLVRHILQQHPEPCRMLDIGTGSGCICVTLSLAGQQVTSFDVSPDALGIARENAERLHATVDFRHEDILHHTATSEQWDAIVSNPPYICRSEAAQMDANVLDYEPHLALFVPDDDPLLFYRTITHYARQHLRSGGWLYLEGNSAYTEQVESLLKEAGYTHTQIWDDPFGAPRFIKGQKP